MSLHQLYLHVLLNSSCEITMPVITIWVLLRTFFLLCNIMQINRLSMDIQIDYFNITRKQIDKLLGPSKAREYISKRSIFSVTVGSNDFLNNYLLPVISIGARITQSPDGFIDDLITHLRDQLTVAELKLSNK